MEPMFSPLDRPENAGALHYLAHGRAAADAAFGPPTADLDTHHLGTHPTVVARLWDELNDALPGDARFLVFDGPALVHPAGTILAVAIGTQYALRFLPPDAATAIAAGAEVVHHFQTVGTTLDLAATFGPEWVFGRFDEREGGWLRAAWNAASLLEPVNEPASL